MVSSRNPFIVWSLVLVQGGVLEILHTHLVFIFLGWLVYVEGTPGQRYSPLDENIPP